MPTGRINIGGFDDNAFYDCRGVNYLTDELMKTSRIMPNFNRMDKWPNLDGSFLVCEQPEQANGIDNHHRIVIPKCKFEVQIKTLNSDYVNHNTEGVISDYKYSCDTKAMNYVLMEITHNPVLLLFVDYEKKHIFWKHLSKDYCESLKIGEAENKTVYFNNSDKITDLEQWIETLIPIHEALASTNRRKAMPIFPVPPEAQEAVDFINDCFDNELKFIKQSQYPNVWKFGINYVEKGEYGSYAGIYKINQGESVPLVESCEGEADSNYISQMYFNGYTLMDMVKRELKERIELFFDKKKPLPIRFMPNCALMEIFFHEVDGAFFDKQTDGIENDQNGKSIIIHWPKNDITFDEYQRLIDECMLNDKAQKCAEELLRRSISSFVRPFEDNPNFTIDIRAIGNGRSIGFNPQYDLNELNKHNMRKFLDGIMDFYNEGRALLEGFSTSHLSLKGHHKYWISADFSVGCHQTIDAEDFQFEWEEVPIEEYPVLRKNIMMSPAEHGYSSVGESLVLPIDYSWAKLWRAIFMCMALRIVGENEDGYHVFRNS